jgi:nitrite reductase/ring-hydroxylating ferredoxin subunit
MSKRNEEWVDVIPTTRLAPGEVVPVTVGGLDLLIVAPGRGNRIYAIANSCPHLGTPLEIGQLVRLPKEETTTTTTTTTTPPSSLSTSSSSSGNKWTELQVSNLLQQDGCEDCIVCPLHRTAFALESGQVRGEWCPYPPVVGKLTSFVKDPTPVATFDVRVRKKTIQVRLNSPLPPETKEPTQKK